MQTPENNIQTQQSSTMFVRIEMRLLPDTNICRFQRERMTPSDLLATCQKRYERWQIRT